MPEITDCAVTRFGLRRLWRRRGGVFFLAERRSGRAGGLRFGVDLYKANAISHVRWRSEQRAAGEMLLARKAVLLQAVA